MNTLGYHTLNEIMSQPDAWAAALDSIQQQVIAGLNTAERYDTVIFTGCGSTYYLAIAAAALYRELGGGHVLGLPASELWLYPRTAYAGKGGALLVAISRSGETTETVRACEAFRERGLGDVITLSCYGNGTLASLGNENYVIPSGQEQSVAQTRAFTSLYVAVSALIALWTDQRHLLEELRQLPSVGQRLLQSYQHLARQYANTIELDRFYFLGSGLFYGLACELSLKMKEMSLSHSEPFHFMEFRHGPQSMISPTTLIIGLVSETAQQYEQSVLADMTKGKVSVLTLGEQQTDIAFMSNVSEQVRGVLYLPIGQLLAFERAVSRNLNPDRPNNLEAVVRLNGAG